MQLASFHDFFAEVSLLGFVSATLAGVGVVNCAAAADVVIELNLFNRGEGLCGLCVVEHLPFLLEVSVVLNVLSLVDDLCRVVGHFRVVQCLVHEHLLQLPVGLGDLLNIELLGLCNVRLISCTY